MPEIAHISAMSDELSKIAIDVRRVSYPGLPPGRDAMFLNAEMTAKQPLAKELAQGRPKLIVERPLEEWRASVASLPQYAGNEELIDRVSRVAHEGARRHELTHYLRDKAGKLPPTDKPGFRNTLRLLREEGIAHFEGLKPVEKLGPDYLRRASANVVPGTLASTRSAYGPIRRAMMSGTLKPLLPLAERLKLVR
jgi:hypothetical protein